MRDPFAYARRALDAECATLSSTGQGRNDQVNRSGFALGQFIPGGYLSRPEVEHRIMAAAEASGIVRKDGPATVRASMRSGLDAGMRQPRNLGGGEPPRATVHILRPKPQLSGVDLPEWIEPDEEGKPKFISLGQAEPKRFDDEVRRHVYMRDGEPVRVKTKNQQGRFTNWFRVRRPSDGAVGWQAKKPAGWVDVPYVPAGAPNPFDPQRCGEMIAWPEGEKDADALAVRHWLAFTFGGTSDCPDLAGLLEGHHVVIMGDNDVPGEKAISRKIEAALQAGAATVKVVRFPDLPEGGDVSDFFDQGGQDDDLLDRAERIDPTTWQASADDDRQPRMGTGEVFNDPQANASAPPAYSITARPFVWRDPSTFPRRQWLYGRHLVRKFLSCTVAPGGVGKSSLQLVEAIAMATGRLLLGTQVVEPLTVWIINLEDPLEELERRVLAVLLHFNIHPDELGGRLFLNSGRDTKVVIASTTKAGTMVARPVVDALKAEIRAKGADVIVIDPLVKAHQVPENDNGAVDMVCTAFAEIADECDCAFDLIHHVRKTNGAEVTVEDGRGAVSLLAACRSARALNRMSKDEAERAGVSEARLYFRAENGKGNLAPPEKAEWFNLRSVSLGNGTPGVLFDDGDQVAVATSWTWPDALEGVKVADLRKVQLEISRSEWRENIQTRDRWVGHAVAAAMGLDAEKPSDRSKIRGLLSVWIKTGALKLVDKPDAKREIRTFVEVGEWATD
jgi:hypothetical protein